MVSDLKCHTISHHTEEKISSVMIAVKHFDIQDNLVKCNHKQVSQYLNKEWINCSCHFAIAIFISAQIFLGIHCIADITYADHVSAHDDYEERNHAAGAGKTRLTSR